jgi:hypothetical protein
MQSLPRLSCVEGAFMELDPTRLTERIGVAMAAIDARLFYLRNDSDHHKERQLISDAQRTLKFLREIK